jgi:glycosyltransferase involved in cell wall biosynthesis
MPKISVVIPVYNGEKTIIETIESVQKQSFSYFELIVINDGSTDKSMELIQNVKDQRLKIFSYQNGGLSVARNRGIDRATGEFSAFLDADDLWTPDKLELQVAALQQCPESGVAYSWTRYIDEQGKSFFAGRRIFFEGNVLANLLITNFLLSGSNPLIRKQAIGSVGGFDSTLAPVADWDFYLRHLWMTIRLQPQSLLERDTQRLALKFMMRRVLPPRVARYLIQVFKKTRPSPDLKFQK